MPATPEGAGAGWRWLLPLGAAVVVGAYLWHASSHGRWQVDDAGITFAYARNIAHGYGPVTNPGDLVVNEGFSNPAWTFLLATTMVLGLFDLVWTPKLLSVGFTLLAFGLTASLVQRFDGGRERLAMLLPAAFLVANGSFVVWSIGGLENAQYVATLLAALALYLRDVSDLERRPLSGPLFFLVAISRPEGLIYTVAAGTDALARGVFTRRIRWLGQLIAGVAVPLALYVAWHLWMFGDLLPNTYYAKARNVSVFTRVFDPRSGGWRYLLEGFALWGQAPLVLLAVAAVVDRESWRRGLGALLLALCGSVLFVLQSNGDWMMQYRFASTTFALLALLAALGLATLRRLVFPDRSGWMIELGLGALTLVSVGWNLPDELDAMIAKPTVPLQDRITRLPRLLEVTDSLGVQRPVILMSDMGGPMWVNDTRQAVLLDMFGLCDREVAHALYDSDLDRLWRYGFEDHHPELMQFPPTVYDRWRLDACVSFLDGYVHLDDHHRQDARTGYFLRRDLIEPAWRDSYATGEVVVQRPVRLHAVRLVESTAAEATLELDFSLMRTPAGTPRARVMVQGQRGGDLTIPLLPGLPPSALAPDRIYRARERVALPDGLGPLTEVLPLGTLEPSNLPAPPVWQTTSLYEGGEIPSDVIRGRSDLLSREEGHLVLESVDPRDTKLCLGPLSRPEALRLEATLGIRGMEGRLDLDLRWFDAAGAFAGRKKVWSWHAPMEESEIELALPIPDAAATLRACWHFREGGGELTLRDVRWRWR